MIRLRIVPTPIERTSAFVAISGFAEEEIPLRGLAGRLDWLLGGEASRLILEGRLDGSWRSQALLASRGRLGARYVLFAGLGKIRGLRLSVLSARMADLLGRLARTSAHSLALPILPAAGARTGFGAVATAMLNGALHGLADCPIDVDLAVCEPDPQRYGELIRAAEGVVFGSRAECGISAEIAL